MIRDKVFNGLKEILMKDEYLAVRDIVQNIKEGDSLIDDLALDSLQVLNLIVQIEKYFNFTCGTEEINIELFDNVTDLIDFIYNKVNSKKE